MYEHTQRFLDASAQWLHEAAVEPISNDMRVAFAFFAAYNAMQAVLREYPGPVDHHPLTSIVNGGAKMLGLRNPDAKLALALRRWEYSGRHRLEPSPVSVDDALAWAARVRDAAVALQPQAK